MMMMGELESSLTAIDWLPHLSVGLNTGSVSTRNPARDDDGGENNDGQPFDGAQGTGPGAGSSESAKPGYSYASLITFAIDSSPDKRMTLSEIYQWIVDKYPYYKDADNGWKVRPILDPDSNHFDCMHGLYKYRKHDCVPSAHNPCISQSC